MPPDRDVPGGELMGMATCSDLLDPADAVGYERLAQLAGDLRRDAAPRLGWTEPWNFLSRCAGLAVGTSPPHMIESADLPPILITNGNSDSATPPEYGRRLAAQLPGARYLLADGGHAVYMPGDPCVHEHVNRYLSTGDLPSRTLPARRRRRDDRVRTGTASVGGGTTDLLAQARR
jgi:pimeloyl-ACP methyl ester carboxylesterase